MNRQRRFEAIILSSYRFGEIHRSLRLLSEYGELVRAIAHGAASAKGRLRGATGVFTRGICYLYTDPVKNSSKITDFDATELYPAVKGSLESFYTVSVWGETVLQSLASGGADDRVFRLFRESLDALERYIAGGTAAAGEAARVLSIRFVWRYLALLGVQPDLQICASCGRAVTSSETLSVRDGAGDVVCGDCAAEGSVLLPAPMVVSRLAEADVNLLSRVAVEEGMSRRMVGALYHLLELALDTRLKTLQSGGAILR